MAIMGFDRCFYFFSTELQSLNVSEKLVGKIIFSEKIHLRLFYGLFVEFYGLFWNIVEYFMFLWGMMHYLETFFILNQNVH